MDRTYTSEKRVFEQIPRLAPAVLVGLSDIAVADAHEVMGRVGLLDPGIAPLSLGTRLCGQAITCLNNPGDNLAIHIGLHLANPGDVLVVTGVDSPPFCCWGNIVTVSAQTKGITGVVTDGYVRDSRMIRAARFPVWARGIHARGAAKRDVGGVNVPVVCGGQTINPGDVVIADDDGVVVIPLALAHDVLAMAKEREEKEARLCEALMSGRSTYEVFGFESVPGGDKTTWSAGSWLEDEQR